MIRDIRFSFEAETLFGFSAMHHTFKSGVIGLRNERLVVRTCVGSLPRYRLGVTLDTRNSTIELLDTAGYIFQQSCFSQFLNGIIEKGDKILLVFDPSDGRELLNDCDEGKVLPCVIEEKIFTHYASVMKWAEHAGISIVPVVTKIDLISAEELYEKVIPSVKSLIPNCTDIIFSTSVLKKKYGQILLQTIGINQLLDLMANGIGREK